MICPVCEGTKVSHREIMLPDGIVWDGKGKCWKCEGTGKVRPSLESEAKRRPDRSVKES